MSRRKDRERLEAMRRNHPDYPGFRGYGREPVKPENTPIIPVVCSRCGRRRNVPSGLVKGRSEDYVCQSCRDEEAGPT